MAWELDYSRLNDILPLEGNVITATYRDFPVEGGLTKPLRICSAMGLARNGSIININGPSGLCSGDYACGLEPAPRPKDVERGVGHNYMSLTLAKRAATLRPHLPCDLGKYLILAPLEKTDFVPDLVIFTCLPSQAYNLVFISNYDSGDERTGVIQAALCRSGITYPLLTGTIQIGLTCHAAINYAKYKPEEMIVSMPTKVLLTILRNQKEVRMKEEE